MDARAQVDIASHQVRRITARTGTTFDDFLARFETIVPPRQIAALAATSSASAEAVKRQVEDATPNSFRVFAALDATSLLAPEGVPMRAVSWLFGNQGIAEHVFSNDPRAILYAPMRLVLFDDGNGEGVISIERPSDDFASLDNPAIAAIGQQLDAKLADLFTALDVPSAADALRTPATRGA